MASSAPAQWEIWHARFDYSEGRGYKYRPVIVLAERADGLLVAMVTGKSNKLHLEHDVLIQDWESAGLDKPSIARLDRIAEIPSGYLGSAGIIGKLSQRDIIRLTAVLSKIIAGK